MRAFTRWWRERRHGVAAGGRSHRPVTRQLEAEFATIFANAAIGIAISDGFGRFVLTNAALDRFLGYGPGELVGVAIKKVSHPEDYALDVQLFTQMHRGERDMYRVEKRYFRKDGTQVWGRLTASVVRSKTDASVYGLAMVEDITEQRRTKEQLDASRAALEDAHRRLKLYLDRAPLACIFWGSDQIVRAWNPAAETLFGYTAEEAIGRNVYELTATPGGLAVIDRVRAEVQAGGGYPDGIVIENRRKDGGRLQCHWHFTVVSQSKDGIDGVIAFGVDVTARIRADQERMLLEANLRHAQKMQSLGTLAGGIAHDFNNILLAISGNTRLAMEDLPEDHPARISLAEVSKAGARASSIVNQILTFSRREELPRAPINLRVIIEESINLLRATLPARVTIQTHVAATAPMVLGDSAQIHQVLLNLATNAAHAMGDAGGLLAIEIEEISVDDLLAHQVPNLHQGRHHRIAVRDSGSGMRPQVVERIFEPFFTTKPHGQGTGLGLSVVHGIVKSHGGAITVSSALGIGTAFYVYLPALPNDAAAAVAVGPHEDVQGQGQRILYVDDEESLVYLITRVLERLGYRVSGYTDAVAALAVFQSDPDAYDAVVTDLSMPGMSGVELSKRVLHLRPQLPVVMTSGYVRTEDRDAVMQAGVRELLLKPNTVEELGEVLHRLLNEGNATSGVASLQTGSFR